MLNAVTSHQTIVQGVPIRPKMAISPLKGNSLHLKNCVGAQALPRLRRGIHTTSINFNLAMPSRSFALGMPMMGMGFQRQPQSPRSLGDDRVVTMTKLPFIRK